MATVQAIDHLLNMAQDSDDFSERELAKVRRVRTICQTDDELIQEAHHLLAQGKHSLERKEAKLSVFMAQLAQSDLENPIISKMLEYFIEKHIEMTNQLQKVESFLDEMYPNWKNKTHLSTPLVPTLDANDESSDNFK